MDPQVDDDEANAIPKKSRPYRLFGNLWLEDPSIYFSSQDLDQLFALRPFLEDLEESSESVSPSSAHEQLKNEFINFQKAESQLWNPPRREDELVHPSGDLNWPISHHLHNPTFITRTPHNGDTEDETNPCIWLIMANTFDKGKTLIYDHLARREGSDGLKEYPPPILQCHEEWLSTIRQRMKAKIEIAYGRCVHARMLKTMALDSLQLWGDFQDVKLYLEWTSRDVTPRKLLRLIVFAFHPQVFLQPWGKKYATSQDRLLWVAHTLSKLNYSYGFYQKLHWSIVNRFPKLAHYAQAKELQFLATKAVEAAKSGPNTQISIQPKSRGTDTYHNRLKQPHYAPGAWSSSQARNNRLAGTDYNQHLIDPTHLCPSERLLMQSEGTKASLGTKIDQLIMVDPQKPSKVQVMCKKCSYNEVDLDVKWHRKTGKYIAKMRDCKSCRSRRSSYIPIDTDIKYVTYNAVMVGLSRVGKPYFKPYSRPDIPSFEHALVHPHDGTLNNPQTNPDNGPVAGHVESFKTPSNQVWKDDVIGAGDEHGVDTNVIDKGPFALWHGRRPVISSTGRVTIWVSNAERAQRKKKIQFSAHGSYLRENSGRFLDFNERGISIVGIDGQQLWHADLEMLRLRKGGSVELLEHHQYELEAKADNLEIITQER